MVLNLRWPCGRHEPQLPPGSSRVLLRVRVRIDLAVGVGHSQDRGPLWIIAVLERPTRDVEFIGEHELKGIPLAVRSAVAGSGRRVRVDPFRSGALG